MEKVLIIGCAESGYWASRLMKQVGFDVTITDSREITQKKELEEEGIHVYDNGHPDHLKHTEWKMVIKNPGIPFRVPFVRYFVDAGYEILNEIDVAARYTTHFRYGAITGTNGKTTTTTLLYDILKRKGRAFASGNIGTALSRTVLEHGEEDADISLELGAVHLTGMPTFHPLVSVIMNLTPDHLDFFPSLDAYYDTKKNVYKNQTGDEWFLLNLDDEEVMKRCTDVPCRVVTFSLYQEADLMIEGDWITLFKERLFRKDDLQIVGMHNVQNAMVACAMAVRMGVDKEVCREVIRNFKAPEHRIEFVRELRGVKYYNDSKGTNVDSTVMALRAFDQPVILLAGGHDKHTGFADLYNYKDKMKKLIVFGETREELSHIKEDSIVVETMDEALKQAYTLAEDGDIVLLSPACSSYDQFQNYEQRGRIFKELVRSL